MGFLSRRKLFEIRGKALVGHATSEEILSVFGHLDEMESKLDEADEDDMLGTEGWRHWFGLEDS